MREEEEANFEFNVNDKFSKSALSYTGEESLARLSISIDKGPRKKGTRHENPYAGISLRNA